MCDEGVVAAGSVGCDGELMLMKVLRLLVVLAVMVS